MEHLKCNQLSCRSILRETAVVTTCSHCFCVACANELFGNAQICPACSASLTEPDDIMVASLQPTNDYKTSVLSGLSPGIILQICERAMSFWEYQSRQESAFQQAVLKSVNDKSAQCQKQLDSVIREANSELALLNSKIAGLERDLELERRKNREQQDQLRDKDKEYGRLKGQYDQLKRKVLLAPSTITSAVAADNAAQLDDSTRQDDIGRSRHDAIGLAGFSTLTVNDVVNGMEAGGIQRTPLRGVSTGTLAWQGQPPLNSNGIRGQVAPQKTQRFQTAQVSGLSRGQIEGFGPFKGRRGNSDGNATDSPNEVEAASGLGLGGAHIYRSNSVSAIGSGLSRDQIANRQTQRGFGFGQGMARTSSSAIKPEQQRKSGTFRPAGFSR